MDFQDLDTFDSNNLDVLRYSWITEVFNASIHTDVQNWLPVGFQSVQILNWCE